MRFLIFFGNKSPDYTQFQGPKIDFLGRKLVRYEMPSEFYRLMGQKNRLFLSYRGNILYLYDFFNKKWAILAFPERIFTPEEIQDNAKTKASLVDLLASGNGILMAGSGCTASIYPGWAKLIDLLYKEALTKKNDFLAYNPETDNYLTYVDKVKQCLGPDLYYNMLFRTYTTKETTHEKFHEALCRLLDRGKLRGITTTNYDPVFENALVAVTGKLADPIWIDGNIEPAKVFEFLLSLNVNHSAKSIFHIHGFCHQRDSIVLSMSEYESKYGFRLAQPTAGIYDAIRQGNLSESQFHNLLMDHGLLWTIHRKILWALFATRRLLIMGFSLTDPFFNKMLEFVSKDLHTYGYAQHYLILRIGSLEEKERAKARVKQLKNDFGIETVFFEETPANNGLENFVFELEKALIGDPVRTVAEDKWPSAKIPDGDEELTKQLIELSKRQ